MSLPAAFLSSFWCDSPSKGTNHCHSESTLCPLSLSVSPASAPPTLPVFPGNLSALLSNQVTCVQPSNNYFPSLFKDTGRQSWSTAADRIKTVLLLHEEDLSSMSPSLQKIACRKCLDILSNLASVAKSLHFPAPLVDYRNHFHPHHTPLKGPLPSFCRLLAIRTHT